MPCHMVYHGLFAGTKYCVPLIKGSHNLRTYLRIFQFLRRHIIYILCRSIYIYPENIHLISIP